MSTFKNSPAIYFKSLELENIRCFKGKQTLDLTRGDGIPAQWTLLLGDNGVGKTTLLQCLAWVRPVPEVEVEGAEEVKETEEDKNTDEAQWIGIIPALHDATENAVFEKLLRNYKDGDSLIRAQLIQGTPLSELNSRSNNYEIIFTESIFKGKENGELDEENSTGTPGKYKRELPLVIAYGANRLQAKSYLNIDNDDDPVIALTEITKLIDVEDFLTSLDYAAAKKERKATNHLAKVKKIIAEILPGLSGRDPIKIYGPKLPGSGSERSGVYCKTPYDWVPMSALSLGYRTTTGWIIDLAFRLYIAYPDLDEPLHQPAIVLIDEIDLHLHPMWQRTIIQNLSKHFPNTQFVATAHSPLMVQSASNANLAVIVTVGDHVQINNSPDFLKEWRVDQILTSELFGLTSARNEDIEKKIKRRQKLLQVERTPKQEIELRKLNREIEELPSLETANDQEALDFIRRAAATWQKKSV